MFVHAWLMYLHEMLKVIISQIPNPYTAIIACTLLVLTLKFSRLGSFAALHLLGSKALEWFPVEDKPKR